MSEQSSSGGLQVFGFALNVALQVGILNYLIRLERTGCECAMDWRRTYMIAFLALSILITIFALASGSKMPFAIPALMPVLGLLYVIFVIQYINRLRREKCECSESVFRNIMEILAYIYVLILILTVVIVAIALFSGKTTIKEITSIKSFKAIKSVK